MYDIHTLTYSDLHCVKMDSLCSALQLFPDFFKTFKKELSYSFQVGKQVCKFFHDFSFIFHKALSTKNSLPLKGLLDNGQ